MRTEEAHRILKLCHARKGYTITWDGKGNGGAEVCQDLLQHDREFRPNVIFKLIYE